ncbi:hypothetical protein JK159_04435 [Weissella minor]|uniref:hypothetical protein n=1 Tax=Weissella minor TaxID=1620 RepID=UPI001BB0941A|nr:hypothetical protein [Weissella minor]MBS0949613.1 hypothetical protein [Weissella minor]
MDEQELYEELARLASDNHINIEYVQGHSSDPDVAFTSLRVINMNRNFITAYSKVARLGHEIGHFLSTGGNSPVYHFSPLGKSDAEKSANHWFVEWVARRVYDDTDSTYWNWANLMLALHLPNEFEPVVVAVLNEMNDV